MSLIHMILSHGVKPEVREAVVTLIEYGTTRVGLPFKRLLRWLGLAPGKYYDWKRRQDQPNRHNGQIPNLQRLLPWECDGFAPPGQMLHVGSGPGLHSCIYSLTRQWSRTRRDGGGFECCGFVEVRSFVTFSGFVLGRPLTLDVPATRGCGLYC